MVRDFKNKTNRAETPVEVIAAAARGVRIDILLIGAASSNVMSYLTLARCCKKWVDAQRPATRLGRSNVTMYPPVTRSIGISSSPTPREWNKSLSVTEREQVTFTSVFLHGILESWLTICVSAMGCACVHPGQRRKKLGRTG
ncbi:hypothetical protein RRG08_053040 [Elysia crispata]|uniref:Uncharacterized protein n=1 Tax=Elysia crispata TaxID=231223 RepID=A0AAE0Z5Y8_9GAST|nr:hypothetical protein RRG08_053040 [Elysia crispata]